MQLETLDKLKRARIQIQRSNPFFAYLSLYLKFKEAKEGEIPDWAGMGVNIEGELTYKKEFVDKLSEAELIGVLIHEILHLSLLHLTRRGNRNPTIWNVAADVCVNQIIKKNNYTLPEGAIVSNYDEECTFFKVVIKDCDKKTAEMVYEEIEHLADKVKDKDGYSDGKFKGFDIHNEGRSSGKGKGKGKNEKGIRSHLSEDEKREIEEYWKGKSNEALVTAKLRGCVPAGMERLIGGLSEAKVGWREVLQRYVQRAIPYDYTYASPSKKSVSTGFYLPNTIKDYIDVVVAIDTSGSISQTELKEFLSEVIGISKAFSNRVKIRLLTHDVKVWDDLLVQNGNIEKVKGISVKGGGGTSHKEVFKYVEEKYRDSKLVICFTDGESDLDELDGDKYRFDKVFVISENGSDKQLSNFNAKIIKLKEFKYD